jgi:hypothetical protein
MATKEARINRALSRKVAALEKGKRELIRKVADLEKRNRDLELGKSRDQEKIRDKQDIIDMLQNTWIDSGYEKRQLEQMYRLKDYCDRCDYSALLCQCWKCPECGEKSYFHFCIE